MLHEDQIMHNFIKPLITLFKS